jgi:YggT family protein
MNYVLIQIVQAAAWIFTLMVIADVILSYFMNPYHPVRVFLDRIVQPLLRPIQRVLPPMAGIDFSPMILLVLVSVLESVLLSLLSAGIR